MQGFKITICQMITVSFDLTFVDVSLLTAILSALNVLGQWVYFLSNKVNTLPQVRWCPYACVDILTEISPVKGGGNISEFTGSERNFGGTVRYPSEAN